MDFQQNFSHPKRTDELIVVSWERGYNNVQVHYRDKCIQVIENPRSLLDGCVFHHELLGELELILEQDPYHLTLMIDGLHSGNNLNHPKINVPSTGLNFFIPLVLNGILFRIMLSQWEEIPDSSFNRNGAIIFGLSFLGYVGAIALLWFNKISGFILGASLLVVQSILFIYSLFDLVIWGDFLFGISFMLILHFIFIAFSARTIYRFYKHNQPEEPNQDILDKNW